MPQTVPLTDALADPVEEKALHMVNSDPNRTPTFTMFGNPDFFFQTSNPCSGARSECVTPGFAWNHGDIQQEIGNTWVGIVGPASRNNGIDSTTWTDHTNLRPTILSLVGLQDDYTDDGHVLVQALDSGVTPKGLKGHDDRRPRAGRRAGERVRSAQFAQATLAASTSALEEHGRHRLQHRSRTRSRASTAQRDALAEQIRIALLNSAAFNGDDDQQTRRRRTGSTRRTR